MAEEKGRGRGVRKFEPEVFTFKLGPEEEQEEKEDKGGKFGMMVSNRGESGGKSGRMLVRQNASDAGDADVNEFAGAGGNAAGAAAVDGDDDIEDNTADSLGPLIDLNDEEGEPKEKKKSSKKKEDEKATVFDKFDKQCFLG